jgi:hypothetical protein
LNYFANFDWQTAALGIALFLVTFAGSLALTAWILVRLPADYFHSSHAREFWTDKPAAIRWAGVLGKNLAGLFLVALGIIMSLPGVPGQGLLTILLGVVLLDIPGKRPLEARLLRIPLVRNAVNSLRTRYGKPEMIID